MRRESGVEVARRLVAERFGEVRAAWLGGSVARGTATPTSDLDITVLVPGPPAPYRESLRYGGWPVELFVQTEESLRHYRGKDQARRQPTMMRLVADAVVLHDPEGIAASLQEDCRAEIDTGPAPLTDDELRLARYTITNLLDDLADAGSAAVRAAVAAVLWQDAAVLLLTGARRWSGTGKGLIREVASYDEAHGTRYVAALTDGLRAALDGDVDPLTGAADEVLAPYGGRLSDGLRLGGTTT